MKKFFINLSCLLAVLSGWTTVSAFADEKAATTQGPIHLEERMQSAPLIFVENNGQVTDQHGRVRTDIDFKVPASEVTVFVAPAELHYQWAKPHSSLEDDYSVDIYRLDVELIGANKNAHSIKEQKDGYYENYYLPQCPNGVTAHSFRKITYKDVYPGIDWVLYNNDGHVKYDFVVHPGANPTDIKLKYKGDTEHLINSSGDMILKTPFGILKEQKLYCYNAETGEEIVSHASFSADGLLKFDIADYTGTLIIDPEIEWSTYYGKSGIESGYTVVTDTSGGAYLGGYSTSTTNIATTGAHQTTNAGSKDAYVVRFSKLGARQWATYYGGSWDDDFFSSTIDSDGNVYFAGITKSSSGIATSGSHQPTYGGGNSDAMLVKFNATGTRLWATYYGGSGDESHANEHQVWVACDKQDNVYLCGTTASTGSGVIATSGAYQTSLSGGRDGYLARFTKNGVRLWGTYYGGTNDDKIVKIVFDMVDNVYVAGETKSTSGIATSNSHQPNDGGNGYTDAFLVKFLPTGNRVWGTYYGGIYTDGPEGLASDVYGYIYLSGSTNSPSGIATNGSSQSTLAGYNASNGNGNPQDCFLVKFDTAGVRQWGTYFGGPNVDHCGDMTMDAFGNICFTGFTGSTGIATIGAHQTTIGGGGFDAFMAIFTLGGIKYWASYLGGGAADFGYGLKYSNRGDLYLVGTTTSFGNIATSSSNTYQKDLDTSGRTYPDPYKSDAFMAKFKADTSTFILQPFTLNNVCAGTSFNISYGITNPFRNGNKFIVQLSDANGSFSSPTDVGELTTTNVGTIPCTIPINTPGGTGYRVRIVSTLPQSISLENIYPITIKTLPVKPVAGSNTPVCSDGAALNLTATTTTSGVSYDWVGPNSFTSSQQNPSIQTPPLAASGDYIVTASLNGCFTMDTTSVVVNVTPVITAVTASTPVCAGGNLQLNVSTSTSGVSYTWSGPDTFSATIKNPVVTSIKTSGSGWYVVTVSRITCFSKDSVQVQVNPTFTPMVSIVVSPNDTICLGDTLQFTGTATGGGTAPTYKWQINGVDVNGANSSSLTHFGFSDGDEVRLIYTGSGQCLSVPADTSDPIKVTVQSAVVPTVGIDINPGPVAPENTLILFTALDTNGGSAPEFQWYKNGTAINGAISDVLPQYTKTDLVTGDQICVKMKSSLSCAEPDSTSSCTPLIEVTTGIKGIATNGNLKLFPNPNKGKFTLKGIINFNKELKLDILNALGQTVYTGVIKPENKELNKVIDLGVEVANGIYVLRLTADNYKEIIRFTVSK